jgi:hypothetical protein
MKITREAKSKFRAAMKSIAEGAARGFKEKPKEHPPTVLRLGKYISMKEGAFAVHITIPGWMNFYLGRFATHEDAIDRRDQCNMIISRMIAEGKSGDEIKAALKDTYPRASTLGESRGKLVQEVDGKILNAILAHFANHHYPWISELSRELDLGLETTRKRIVRFLEMGLIPPRPKPASKETCREAFGREFGDRFDRAEENA